MERFPERDPNQSPRRKKADALALGAGAHTQDPQGGRGRGR